MDETTADNGLLKQQNNPYVVPDYYSPDPSSPSSSYERRMSSYRKPLSGTNTSYQGAGLGELTAPSPSSANEGLAIGNIDNFSSTSRSNATREPPVPIDYDGNPFPSTTVPQRSSGAVRYPSGAPLGSPNTPASIDPLLSPPLAQNTGTPGTFYSGDPFLSPSSTSDARFAGRLEGTYGKDDEEEGDLGHASFNPYHASSDHETLRGMDSLASIRPSGGPEDFECKAKHGIMQGRWNWLTVAIIILAIYSSVFSGLWLGIALRKPRYGKSITNSSSITPATASLLYAAFAKSIELSFVTVFVAFLGQVLSRRAFARNANGGITIAEMTMRAWIMQPGTMITHGHTVRYAGWTILGVASLFATVVAMLYTTASDALVTPKLKFGKPEVTVLQGRVSASFANPAYLEQQCKTPISYMRDKEASAATCLAMEHAGQSYHNYMQYLGIWTKIVDQGNGTDVLADRPKPVAMLYDNTTVTGSWIQIQNMTKVSLNYSRIINNVTMAMPHSGVFAAAREPRNNIVQPQDFNGLGEYTIRAAVPAPYVNVLCVNVSADELRPILYEKWSAAKKKPMNSSEWPNNHNFSEAPRKLNNALDDIFGFGTERPAPVFAKMPLPFNTILNFSNFGQWDSLYLLATSGENQLNHMLCSIRGSLTPNCSTEYHASMGGGNLTTNCEDPTDPFSYHKSDRTAPNGGLSKDWVNVAVSWILAVNLNDGINDGKSSNARLLTQLMPTGFSLDRTTPSMSEALAVMAGCTLILSGLGSPFVHFWNYTGANNIVTEPQTQYFNATVTTQDYSSGGTQNWQGLFYVVLITVFVLNIGCLVWFFIRSNFITDFTEPENLFCISLNSPPSQRLEGACGGGPEKEQIATKWTIRMAEEREHYYFEEGDNQPRSRTRKKAKNKNFELTERPYATMYNKLASKTNSIL